MVRDEGDSGLRCPWCEHNLTGLASSRCPECGKPFVIARPGVMNQVRRAFTLSHGLVCPECGHANQSFMPRSCTLCDRPFTLAERVFGRRS